MKVIELTHVRVAIVDDDDFERLAQWRWHYTAGGYARRNGRMINGVKPGGVFMHAEIMKPPQGFEVDHRNLNKLDNRRENLRIVTRSQNAMNRAKQKNNKSGVRGVSWSARDNCWVAEISVNGNRISLGNFRYLADAKCVREKACLKHHGEYARLS